MEENHIEKLSQELEEFLRREEAKFFVDPDEALEKKDIITLQKEST